MLPSTPHIFAQIPDHSDYDKLINVLLKEDVLNPNLKAKKEKLPLKELPSLTSKQLSVFTGLLLRDVEVLPGFQLPIWKVLRRVQKLIQELGISTQDYMQCVGSAEAYIMESDPEYYKGLLEKLVDRKMEIVPFATNCSLEQVHDIDVRIHLPETDAGKNQRLKARLTSWLAEKGFKKSIQSYSNLSTNDLFGLLSKAMSKKFCNPYEMRTDGNRFMLISLGDSNLSLDIVLEQNLRRTKILTPDNGQLSFNIIKLRKDSKVGPIALTHIPYGKVQSGIGALELAQIKPALPCNKMYRVIVDRILKIVHFPNMTTMDYNGWFKLIQYYGKGYRSSKDESLLFEKVICWAKQEAASQNHSEYEFENSFAKKVSHKILDFRDKHYAQNPAGSIGYLLNSIFSLYRLDQKNVIIAVINQLSKEQLPLEGLPDIIVFMTEWLKRNPDDYDLLFNLMQVGSLICLNNITDGISPQNVLPILTFNSNKPAIQWQMQQGQGITTTLMMPFNIKQAFSRVIAVLNKNVNNQRDAEVLMNLLSKGRIYKDKSSSIIHPYLSWIGISPSFFREQLLEHLNTDTPFFKFLSENIFKISDSYEEYQIPPTSYARISRAWESIELHSKLGFKQELHDVFRPYIHTLLQVTVSKNEDRNAFFWNLFKARNILENYSWIYRNETLDKHNILITALESIIDSMPNARMSLDGFLQGFLCMLLEDYLTSPLSREAKTEKVTHKSIKVIQHCSQLSPLSEQLKLVLTNAFPCMVDSLVQKKQWPLLLHLRKSFQPIVPYTETPELALSFFSAFHETLALKKLYTEQLQELIEFIKSHGHTLSQLDIQKRKIFLEGLEAIFQLLLEQKFDEISLQLLISLENINLETYQNCCVRYLEFTETHPQIPNYQERCFKILTGTQKPWTDLQQLKPSDCKLLAENTIRSVLLSEHKSSAIGSTLCTCLTIIRRYNIVHGALWTSYFNSLSFIKDKHLLDESWNYFLNMITNATADRPTSEIYVQCWLKGITILKKQDEAKLGAIGKFYKSLQIHLDDIDKSLTEVVHLTVLQILSDYDCSPTKKNRYSELFANVYALYQNTSIWKNDIEIAILTILSKSQDLEYLSQSIPRIESYLSRFPENKAIYPIIESLYLNAGLFTVASHQEQLNSLCSIYEKASTMPLNWVKIIDVFAQHDSPCLVIRALHQVGEIINPNEDPKSKTNVKIIDVQPKSIVRILNHLIDEKTPLVIKPIPEDFSEYEKKILSAQTQVKAGFAILSNQSVITLLKHENIIDLWVKIYSARLQELIATCEEDNFDDEIQNFICLLTYAPESLSLDSNFQNLIIELLKRYIRKDFSKAMLAETLYLHYALGREKGLAKYPINKVEPLYPDPKMISILNPNTKAPYINSHWMDTYTQFGTKWLKCLIEECDKFDFAKNQGVSYLNYIETRIALMLAKPKPAQAKQIREVVDSYINMMITKNKSGAIEKQFLSISMSAMWHNSKEIYARSDDNTYKIYQTYFCVMYEMFYSKGPHDSLIKRGQKINFVESQLQVLFWTISQITKKEAGIDVCYAWRLFNSFAKKGVFSLSPKGFKEILQLIFGAMKKGPNILPAGQTITHVFAAFDEFLQQGLSNPGTEDKTPVPREAENFMLELHDVFVIGLYETSKAFAANRTESFHPLENCLSFLANTGSNDSIWSERMLKNHFNIIHNVILDVVTDQIKWCLEQGYNKRAEILRLKFFALFQTKGLKISSENKKSINLLMMIFVKKLLFLFPITSAYHKTSLDLADKTFKLANMSGTFETIPKEIVDQLEIAIKAFKDG